MHKHSGVLFSSDSCLSNAAHDTRFDIGWDKIQRDIRSLVLCFSAQPLFTLFTVSFGILKKVIELVAY